MNTRERIYNWIEGERVAQDKKWPRDNPKREQYKFYTPHIVVLEEKLARLRGLWYESKSEQLAAEFVKIAAIAVRALEEVEV